MDFFAKNIEILEELFTRKEVDEKLVRLKFIYNQTENAWKQNLKYFKNNEIKYLLICEAAPWSETEIPEYFYNQTNRKFNKTIWKTFFKIKEFPKLEEEYYKSLADVGFLIIDNNPYSMNYKPKHRNRLSYFKILENYLSHLIEKLDFDNIKISEDLIIAFGFKLNAQQFIKLTNGKLSLKNGNTVTFDEKNICADGSGFPNSDKLSNIFFSKSSDEFVTFNYFNGEKVNPYLKSDKAELDFLNPKSLFWYYENHYYKYCNNEDFKGFIENLLHNKLSEYTRSDFDLWELYFNNKVK